MAADSDGLSKAGGGSCGVVVTCEGDIKDPRFPARLKRLLLELRTLLAEPHPHTLKVNKVEPWNSVRVTLSVPRAAAARLRALAAAGAPQLRALGILSVQLDGDAAVSLRLQHGAELRINTDNSAPDDASTSRSQPNAELLANLGGIGRLIAEGGDGASTSTAGEAQAASRDSFKSPNTVCPMDGKIPQNIPTPADRCEFPFGSMTQARVIHRKENTLGISGPSAAAPRTSPAADGVFVRPSTSAFVGPPPPYPQPQPQTQHQQVAQSPQPPSAPSSAPPTVAMSSPLLVNLLQNDAPAPQPRAKPPHPAKLDRLEDGQVELAVGRAPFEYRARPAPSPRPPSSPAPLPPPSPRPAPRPAPYIRRTFPSRPPVQYRPPVPNATVVGRSRFPTYGDSFPPPPPPPYRGARPTRLGNPTVMMPQQQQQQPQQRVTQEDLQALMPPSTTSMDQKTQSSFQEFQRYQQQYIARQRAASSTRPAHSSEWSEPYRDLGLTLSDLPDSCDLDQLLPTLGADLNLDELSDLDANTKLDFYDQPSTSDAADAPDALLHEITGQNYHPQSNGPYEHTPQTQQQPQPVHTSQPHQSSEVPSKRDAYDESTFMPPPPVPPNKFVPASPAVCAPPSPFRSPPATYSSSTPSSSGNERIAPPVTQSPQSSMPPPMKVPMRPNASILTATVGSQASQSEIEEQSKQYLIKTLMRDDAPPKEEKKPEEITVAQVSQPSPLVSDQERPETSRETSVPVTSVTSVTPAPEIFGIAKSIPEDDGKDKLKNKLVKNRDDKISQKGGKPRNSNAKEKPGLKDKIARDGKSTKVALPRPNVAKPPTPTGEAPKSPMGEKESIKLRLKLDKNEPVVQPVYKADVSFVNQQKGEKPTEGELRVPPLHISLRGRNSAVIKNSKKEKKKFSPGDIHSKKFKIRKTLEEEKSHRRDSEESIASKSGMSTEIKTDEYLKSITLNNHFNEGDGINEIATDNNVVFRMKTISKNAHIVTKHDYKLNNKQSIDLKMKKKLKILSDAKPEKERDKEWRNDTLDKEGKYAQNEGYREMNNHDKKKLPAKDNGANCDIKTDGMTVQLEDGDKSGASDVDSRMLKCKPLDWTLGEARASEDNKLKRTITESAITSPNGLLPGEKKRKTSHSSCPDPPVGSTNVGTIAASRVDSPPPASSQRPGAASPRRKERPKDKSYCKLVAERNANATIVANAAAIANITNATDKFGSRSPASQAQGEDSGIESMDALSEKSPNQASQSPPGPQRKERLDMPRSTSPTSVQRIIGVIDAPPASDDLLERLSRAGSAPHYATGPPDIDLGDIEAELAKMHADHVNGDDAPRRPPSRTLRTPRPARDCGSREATPILRDDERTNIDRVSDVPLDLQTKPDREPETSDTRHPETGSPKKEKTDDFDPLPCRVSPPLYTYSNQEKASPSTEVKLEKPGPANGETRTSTGDEKPEPKLERLQLKADFPDKSLLEQLLIEIPTPDYSKRPESPSPSALERVARTSVRTRSSSKMNSPADGARTPRLSPGIGKERADSPALQPRNCLRSGSVDKTSPRTTAAPAKPVPAPAAKRKRRESESSCASAVSCEEGVSPGRPKKKPRRTDSTPKPSAPAPAGVKTKKDSDSDSDEPLICKVRGKGKGVRGAGKLVKGEAVGAGVGTRRSVRHGAPPASAAPLAAVAAAIAAIAAAPAAAAAAAPAPPAPAPAPPLNNMPVRRKTRSAVGEGTGTTPVAVRRRRASRDGK